MKFLLPHHDSAGAEAEYYRCGNHAQLAKGAHGTHRTSMRKILVECDSVKFDENSRRIRVDFTQKRRFIANDSFKPVC